ncbi:MAG TPA: hypothetical protein VKH19_15500 [Gemmatimonadaceae bacterium]|nr:hypothetical protein [Gemmatimonadaceae bacterium]
MRGVAITLAVLLALPAGSAAAQQMQASTLSPGVRLRVIAVDSRQSAEGRLLSIGHDTLWLRRPYDRDTLRYLSPMIARLQVSKGMTPNEGALRGGAIAFVGTLAVASFHPRTTHIPACVPCDPGPASHWYLLPAATLGGALIGTFIARSRWTDVPWPPSEAWQRETVERSVLPGRHVRVQRAGAAEFTGIVLQRRPDTLVFLGPIPYRDTVRVTFPDITSIEVGDGRSRAHREVIGTVVGTGVGVLAGYYAASLNSCRGCDDVALTRMVWTVPLGAAAGAFFGWHSGDERWTPLRWPP